MNKQIEKLNLISPIIVDIEMNEEELDFLKESLNERVVDKYGFADDIVFNTYMLARVKKAIENNAKTLPVHVYELDYLLSHVETEGDIEEMYEKQGDPDPNTQELIEVLFENIQENHYLKHFKIIRNFMAIKAGQRAVVLEKVGKLCESL